MSMKFKTTDIGLAATLRLVGYELEGLERVDDRRVKFIFAKDEQIEADSMKFYQGQIELPANKVLESLKNLKTYVYDFKQRNQ